MKEESLMYDVKEIVAACSSSRTHLCNPLHMNSFQTDSGGAHVQSTAKGEQSLSHSSNHSSAFQKIHLKMLTRSNTSKKKKKVNTIFPWTAPDSS